MIGRGREVLSHRRPSISFVFFVAVLLSQAGAGQGPIPVSDLSRAHEAQNLDSTWLVRTGDDPRYASLDFDDSAWLRFDPKTSITDLLGAAHPEIIWYRIHLKVDPASAGFALSAGQIGRAFEIYANGDPILTSGQVKPYEPYTSEARLLARIPDRLVSTGGLVIALRVHISPAEWANDDKHGYEATDLTIGQYTALEHNRWLLILGQNMAMWLDHLLLISLGFIALVLFIAQPAHKPYLWIAIVGAFTIAQTPVPLISAFRNIPLYWEIIDNLQRLFLPYLAAALYFSFIQKRIGWGWCIFLAIAGVGNAGSVILRLIVPVPGAFPFIANVPIIAVLAFMIPFVLAMQWWRGNREAGILLVPIVLFAFYTYALVILGIMLQFDGWRETALRGLTVIDHSRIGPIEIPFEYLSSIASSISLGIIVVLRSTIMSHRHAHLEAELEAAQQVQQVLLPEQIGHLRGFQVDSIYLPAQQVGGDFFQILPDGESGLLVVVGDVAGKGLSAAMLVSVLVGAVRATAEFIHEPSALLRRLNERLVGRVGGGFSTAIAVHIAADGWMCIANAGHLPPYLDGKELEVPGGLPLGVVPDIEYAQNERSLDPGSRLVLFSDGVVEAKSRGGELFGFERTCKISTQPAAVIADTARRFGQEDDITVVTIERNPVEVNRVSHMVIRNEPAILPNSAERTASGEEIINTTLSSRSDAKIHTHASVRH